MPQKQRLNLPVLSAPIAGIRFPEPYSELPSDEEILNAKYTMQGMPVVNRCLTARAYPPRLKKARGLLQLACGKVLKLEIFLWTVVCVRLLNVHGRINGYLLSN